MKNWISKALALLSNSLEKPKHEHHELDWKVGLSSDKKRLLEHLSAKSNLSGGRITEYNDIQIGNNWDTFFLNGPKVSDDFMNERAEKMLVKRDNL